MQRVIIELVRERIVQCGSRFVEAIQRKTRSRHIFGRNNICGILTRALAGHLQGFIVLSQDGVRAGQVCVRDSVARATFDPFLKGLRGFVLLARHQLIVSRRNMKFLALAGMLAELKCFR